MDYHYIFFIIFSFVWAINWYFVCKCLDFDLNHSDACLFPLLLMFQSCLYISGCFFMTKLPGGRDLTWAISACSSFPPFSLYCS